MIQNSQLKDSRKRKVFPIRFTIAVFVIFLLNFYTGISRVEPYPTLLLPDGPNIITKDANNNVRIASKALCAMDSTNKWVTVDLDKLGENMPLPSFYLSAVNFGLNADQSRLDKFKNMLHIGKSEIQRQAEERHFQRWLGDKLKKQRLKSDSVHIKLIVRTFSMETHKIIHEAENHESNYSLR